MQPITRVAQGKCPPIIHARLSEEQRYEVEVMRHTLGKTHTEIVRQALSVLYQTCGECWATVKINEPKSCRKVA